MQEQQNMIVVSILSKKYFESMLMPPLSLNAFPPTMDNEHDNKINVMSNCLIACS